MYVLLLLPYRTHTQAQALHSVNRAAKKLLSAAPYLTLPCTVQHVSYHCIVPYHVPYHMYHCIVPYHVPYHVQYSMYPTR